MSFEKEIIELQTKKRRPRSEFVNKIQISYCSLSKYETDECFLDKETLKKIAYNLDASINHMRGRTTKYKYDIETTSFHVACDRLRDGNIELVENLIKSLQKNISNTYLAQGFPWAFL